jgi:enamine deaminase RidA (YjgF/YER057c/UK114 family)
VCRAAGGDFDRVVRVTVYLTDLANFAKVNEVMSQNFKEPYPARAAIGVASLPRGSLVEVDAVMYLG